jgi:glycyl-tRNA synthetase beta chain
MSHSAPLLIELLTEELPPKSLKRLGLSFSEQIVQKLITDGLAKVDVQYRSFATPRRLAVYIAEVFEKAADRDVKEKLLPVAIGLTPDGKPSAPLLKKLASLDIVDFDIRQLKRQGEGKNETFFIQLKKKGIALTAGVQAALDTSIAQLPIAKTMHYQIHPGSKDAVDVQFVRPAHRLIALHGTQVVPVHALGLHADRVTRGHRFLSQGEISITDSDSYEDLLKTQGKVIPNFEERLASIKSQLQDQANQDQVLMPEALLEEVNALVECPKVYSCKFEQEFLDVPQECLILTMQTNQKYFALTDEAGKLVNRFLIVSNIETTSPDSIISGNERVVRPRLSDAKFFYQQDLKTPLIERFEQLSKVVYHNKLGNQKERIGRIILIAQYISGLVSNHFQDSVELTSQYSLLCERGAKLMKADLLTDMVGEFPELQGIMGRYYATHDGEHPEVAQACAEHYLPRFAGDVLPTSRVGLILALADKLETIVGIWGIGLSPTGEKDPYALRRHALGVCRLVVENNLPIDLIPLLQFCLTQFKSDEVQQKASISDILQFLKDRLKSLVKDSGNMSYSSEEIESVLANIKGQFNEVPPKLQAVHHFQTLPQASILANANKRLNNILKKNVSEDVGLVNESILELSAEKNLFTVLQELEPLLKAAFIAQDFASSLQYLTKVSAPVEAFFNDVMVMDPDLNKRRNRLALLNQLHQQLNQVADLSQLAK